MAIDTVVAGGGTALADDEQAGVTMVAPYASQSAELDAAEADASGEALRVRRLWIRQLQVLVDGRDAATGLWHAQRIDAREVGITHFHLQSSDRILEAPFPPVLGTRLS
jgi:hypothetical protein